MEIRLRRALRSASVLLLNISYFHMLKKQYQKAPKRPPRLVRRYKFSQSHFRIQTRSQRHSRDPDGAQVEGWCVYARDTRQGPEPSDKGDCFSSIFFVRYVR